MADRLIHQRVFKVSKELNRLDLICEQHRRQTGHREGLPDWETPHTPAGKASSRHHRTPAFFAWDDEPQQTRQRMWQTETPQKVARTLEMTERESDRDAAPEERSSYACSNDDGRESTTVVSLPPGQIEDDGRAEDTAIVVDDSEDKSSEEDHPVVTGRSITVSPMREDILDRSPAPNVSAATALPRNPQPPAVEVPLSPYCPPSSPRYRHGRRLNASDAVVPSHRAQPFAAGVTTVQADRYRMNRSSGKRFRSPAKQTSLWGDLCNSYIHQSGAANSGNNNNDASSYPHKRQARSAAERTFGGSSVFRTLNMDCYGWPQAARGERRPVLTGSDAINVANLAVREFLGGQDEESKRSETPVQQGQPQRNNVDYDRNGSVNGAPDVLSTPTTSNTYRKSKRVSFGSNSSLQLPNEDPSQRQPRTLPVLADKTTQTEDFLLAARKHARSTRIGESDHHEIYGNRSNCPVRCAACDTTVDESGRPRKVPRASSNSVGAAPTQQRNFRRTSSHLTNPIMTNPRYPPEPMLFRGRSMNSTVFSDRLAWR